MDYLIICTVAVLVAGITLFSGFGLGTVLTPTFALFVPVYVAVAATAIVHLANNAFKLALVGRHADWSVAARFALPAALGALAGAGLLAVFADQPPFYSYSIGERLHVITPVKAVIGTLIVLFALLKFMPAFADLVVPHRYIVFGGLVSGFFGGLSGNQGALRSAVLISAGLSKEAFIGTGVVSAVTVDLVRLGVYGYAFHGAKIAALEGEIVNLVGAAALAAFLGSFIGARLLGKVSLPVVQGIVAISMALVGAGLASGLI